MHGTVYHTHEIALLNRQTGDGARVRARGAIGV